VTLARTQDFNATAQDLAMNIAMRPAGQKRDADFYAPAQIISADAKTAHVQPTPEAVRKSQQDARLEKAGISKRTQRNIANRATTARTLTHAQMTKALGQKQTGQVSANTGDNSRYIAGRGWSRRQFNPKRGDLVLNPTKTMEAPLEQSMLDKTVAKMQEEGISFITGPKPSHGPDWKKMLELGKTATFAAKIGKMVGAAIDLAEAADPALLALEAVSPIRHDRKRAAPGMAPTPA
jgi:hypothetical protein